MLISRTNLPKGTWRRVYAHALVQATTVMIMGTMRNHKMPTVRNERGVAKTWPVASHRMRPDLKALVERTASHLDCSQAVAINLILDHVETGVDGLPTWVEEEQPNEEALPLDKIA